ncbi:MAG: hypothetical protein H6R18_2747 [Proteobacteria bacterium]|nr:hypothetical protein [Pseudomonadota bacterium]
MNFVKKMTGVAVLAAVSSVAFADCSSPLSSYAWYMANGDQASANQIAQNHPECFAGGAATSNASINATAFSQVSAISSVISARFSNVAAGPSGLASAGLNKGLAAGGKAQSWNMWANVEKNDTDLDYKTGTRLVTGSNDIVTTVLGADYTFSPALVGGVSVAFDNGDGRGKTVNTAFPFTRNQNDTGSDGFLIAPYVGYQLSKEFVLDATVGLGKGNYSATGGVKAEADRWFAATNLSYNRWMGNVQLTGKLSYLHGEEDYGDTKVNGAAVAKTGATNKLDQIRLGVQAGYWVNGFMPYAGLGYSNNVNRESDAGKDPLGRDTFLATIGVNFFGMNSKITGGLAYTQELNRDHSDNQIFSGNINFRF